MVVEVSLDVGGFDVDRGVEMTMVNTDTDVQRSDMGGGSVPGEVDGMPTVELFKESSEGVRPMGQSRNTKIRRYRYVKRMNAGRIPKQALEQWRCVVKPSGQAEHFHIRKP